MSEKFYCLKCKTYTDNLEIKKGKTKNNKIILKANCKICGKIKSKFIKNFDGSGIVNSVLKYLPEMHIGTDGPGEYVEGGDFIIILKSIHIVDQEQN